MDWAGTQRAEIIRFIAATPLGARGQPSGLGFDIHYVERSAVHELTLLASRLQ